jgi:hypothetical protein
MIKSGASKMDLHPAISVYRDQLKQNLRGQIEFQLKSLDMLEEKLDSNKKQPKNDLSQFSKKGLRLLFSS